MRPGENFGVEETVHRSGDRLGVRLPPDLQHIWEEGHVDLFFIERAVERQERQYDRRVSRRLPIRAGAILLGSLGHVLRWNDGGRLMDCGHGRRGCRTG